MSTQVRDRIRLDIKSFSAPSLGYTLRPAEMVAAGLAIGLVVLVVLYYFLSLAPVEDQLRQAQKDEAAQRLVLLNPGPAVKTGPSQGQQIQLAKDSLSEFQNDHLRPLGQGRIDMINEINQLAKSDNVRLGGGIEMRTLYRTLVDSDSQGSKKKKEVDTLDVFPRVQFHFAVRGEYKDLRKFLRDLESSREYVIIDSLNISTTEQKQGRGARAVQPAPASGLSLTVSMNTYFRP